MPSPPDSIAMARFLDWWATEAAKAGRPRTWCDTGLDYILHGTPGAQAYRNRALGRFDAEVRRSGTPMQILALEIAQAKKANQP